MTGFRFLSLFLSLCVVLAGLPAAGRATTLTYTSDAIVEFDLFHRWAMAGSIEPAEPSRAAWAKLHIDFNETLDDLSFYRLGGWSARSARSAGGAISDFTLSVETDKGRYALSSFFTRDFQMVLETGVRGFFSDWEIDWAIGSSDYYRLDGSGGFDRTAWVFEYIKDSDETTYWGSPDVWEASGGGDFTGGHLSAAAQVSPVPLPAPLLLLLGGIGALWGLRRRRAVRGA